MYSQRRFSGVSAGFWHMAFDAGIGCGKLIVVMRIGVVVPVFVRFEMLLLFGLAVPLVVTQSEILLAVDHSRNHVALFKFTTDSIEGLFEGKICIFG